MTLREFERIEKKHKALAMDSEEFSDVKYFIKETGMYLYFEKTGANIPIRRDNILKLANELMSIYDVYFNTKL